VLLHEEASSLARETKCRPSGTSPAETCSVGCSISVARFGQFALRNEKHGAPKSTYNANISINRGNPFVRPRFQKLAGNDLFHCENHSILASYPDRCSSVLNCLDSIFNLCTQGEVNSETWSDIIAFCKDKKLTHLEIPAIGREDGVRKIISRTYGRLFREKES
jgi:hypothetical protein